MDLVKIADIPFVENAPTDQRLIFLLAEFSNDEWNIYVQPKPQLFHRLKAPV